MLAVEVMHNWMSTVLIVGTTDPLFVCYSNVVNKDLQIQVEQTTASNGMLPYPSTTERTRPSSSTACLGKSRSRKKSARHLPYSQQTTTSDSLDSFGNTPGDGVHEKPVSPERRNMAFADYCSSTDTLSNGSESIKSRFNTGLVPYNEYYSWQLPSLNDSREPVHFYPTFLSPAHSQHLKDDFSQTNVEPHEKCVYRPDDQSMSTQLFPTNIEPHEKCVYRPDDHSMSTQLFPTNIEPHEKCVYRPDDHSMSTQLFPTNIEPHEKCVYRPDDHSMSTQLFQTNVNHHSLQRYSIVSSQNETNAVSPFHRYVIEDTGGCLVRSSPVYSIACCINGINSSRSSSDDNIMFAPYSTSSISQLPCSISQSSQPGESIPSGVYLNSINCRRGHLSVNNVPSGISSSFDSKHSEETILEENPISQDPNDSNVTCIEENHTVCNVQSQNYQTQLRYCSHEGGFSESAVPHPVIMRCRAISSTYTQGGTHTPITEHGKMHENFTPTVHVPVTHVCQGYRKPITHTPVTLHIGAYQSTRPTSPVYSYLFNAATSQSNSSDSFVMDAESLGVASEEATEQVSCFENSQFTSPAVEKYSSFDLLKQPTFNVAGNLTSIACRSYQPGSLSYPKQRSDLINARGNGASNAVTFNNHALCTPTTVSTVLPIGSHSNAYGSEIIEVGTYCSNNNHVNDGESSLTELITTRKTATNIGGDMEVMDCPLERSVYRSTLSDKDCHLQSCVPVDVNINYDVTHTYNHRLKTTTFANGDRFLSSSPMFYNSTGSGSNGHLLRPYPTIPQAGYTSVIVEPQQYHPSNGYAVH